MWVRFKAVWPSKFDFIWPTEKEVALSKREFARDFGLYSRAQIDKAIEHCKHEIKKGEERKFMEPNPLVLLGVLSGINLSSKMYRHTAPRLPIGQEVRGKRKKAAAEGIGRLKSLFDD